MFWLLLTLLACGDKATEPAPAGVASSEEAAATAGAAETGTGVTTASTWVQEADGA